MISNGIWNGVYRNGHLSDFHICLNILMSWDACLLSLLNKYFIDYGEGRCLFII